MYYILLHLDPGSHILQLIFIPLLSWMGEIQFPFAANPSHPFIVDRLVRIDVEGVIEETTYRRLLGAFRACSLENPRLIL